MQLLASTTTTNLMRLRSIVFNACEFLDFPFAFGNEIKYIPRILQSQNRNWPMTWRWLPWPVERKLCHSLGHVSWQRCWKPIKTWNIFWMIFARNSHHLLTFLWKWIASISARFIFTLRSIGGICPTISFMAVNIAWKCCAHALKYNPMAKKKIAVDMWTNENTHATTFWTQKRQAQPMNESSLKGVLNVVKDCVDSARSSVRYGLTSISAAKTNSSVRCIRLARNLSKRRTLPNPEKIWYRMEWQRRANASKVSHKICQPA